VTDVAEAAPPAIEDAGAMPAEFAGCIGIEWPAADVAAGNVMPGWQVTPYDADGPVTTVESFTLVAHASAAGIVWAEVTLLTDADGRPVLHLPEGEGPHFGEDGEASTGTFPFLVTGMRVKGQ